MLVSLGVFATAATVVAVDEESAERRGEPRAEVERDVRNQIITTVIVSGPLALLLAAASAYLVTRRVMRPIDDVIHAAAGMSAEDLHRRLPAPSTDDELAGLVHALNGLFTRLERGYAAQASFASQASHELRTPLTVITTELEVALSRPRSHEEWHRSAAVVLQETRRASRLVEALLRHARAILAEHPSRRITLERLILQVASEHAVTASQAGVELQALVAEELKGAFVNGDTDALGVALGSVLANAVRYTPAGGRVSIRVEGDGPAAHRIHVDDTGPGVEAAERETVFEPFVRGAEGRRAEAAGRHAGSGLGLSLARSIAEAHGGKLSVTPSPLGGARFTFTLPAAPAPEPNEAMSSGVRR